MPPRTMLSALILLLCCLNGCQNGSQPCDPGDCDGCTPEKCRPQVFIVAWTAEWCPQCQHDKALLAKAKGEGINVVMVPFDENKGLAKRLEVRYLPTYFIYVEKGIVLREDEVKRTDVVERAVEFARKLKGQL